MSRFELRSFLLSLLVAFNLPQPLADAYGLLMHRNGQWEWTLAPGVSPSPRYQHAAVSDDYNGVHYTKLFVAILINFFSKDCIVF